MATQKPKGDWEQMVLSEIGSLDPRQFIRLLDKEGQSSKEFREKYGGPLQDAKLDALLQREMERRFRLLTPEYGGPGKPLFHLYGGTLTTHLRMQSSVIENTSGYFRYGSKLFRAIDDHISHAKDCVLIERPGHVVGTSAHSGVHFQDAHLYADSYVDDPKDKGEIKRKIAVPAKVYSLEITVDYVEPGEDYDDRRSGRRFFLKVPIDLELNFTQDGFNAWIAETKKKRDAEAGRSEALGKLRELVKRFPKETKEMLRE
jgi:hypothetical protein